MTLIHEHAEDRDWKKIGGGKVQRSLEVWGVANRAQFTYKHMVCVLCWLVTANACLPVSVHRLFEMNKHRPQKQQQSTQKTIDAQKMQGKNHTGFSLNTPTESWPYVQTPTLSVSPLVPGITGSRCPPLRQVGVSMCWQRRWGSVSKAQWWWSSNYLTWGRSSPMFYTAASQNNLQLHTAYFLRPRRGSSFVWMSYRPLESTDWFHSQSDKQRQLWIQCRHPWWRSGSLRQQPLCSAKAGGIQQQCSSGYLQGRSTGPI